VGLAAGYDKSAVALPALAALGFGHLEAGTVTCLSQAGNPRPRLHRLPADYALVNQMGFPNAGAAPVLARLPRARSRLPAGVGLGINLGLGRNTPLEAAAEDFARLFSLAHAFGAADYTAINISSPNTPGLRRLQARRPMTELLGAVTSLRDALRPRLPVLVKLAPDLAPAELEAALEAALEAGVDGLIAANTTLSRNGAPGAAALPGGLSGAPLRQRATEVIRQTAACTQGRLPIIGVGGILSAADAIEKLEAGAWMVQVYTGLVYHGPGFVRSIHQGLLRRCEELGLPGVAGFRRLTA
jgi:dihydroorotate dehydrogenase